MSRVAATLAPLLGPWLAIALGLSVELGCGGAPARPVTTRPIALQVQAVDGEAIDVAAYRGRPVVLHLFTTWSLAAQQDVPQLVEAARTYGDLIQIIGIGLDPDGHVLLAPWRRANEIPYLVGAGTADLLDPSGGRSPLGRIVEVPTTIVLDPGGGVAHRIARPLAPGELGRLLDSMLPER